MLHSMRASPVCKSITSINLSVSKKLLECVLQAVLVPLDTSTLVFMIKFEIGCQNRCNYVRLGAEKLAAAEECLTSRSGLNLPPSKPSLAIPTALSHVVAAWLHDSPSLSFVARFLWRVHIARTSQPWILDVLRSSVMPS